MEDIHAQQTFIQQTDDNTVVIELSFSHPADAEAAFERLAASVGGGHLRITCAPGDAEG